jgi:hypothetical protein
MKTGQQQQQCGLLCSQQLCTAAGCCAVLLTCQLSFVVHMPAVFFSLAWSFLFSQHVLRPSVYPSLQLLLCLLFMLARVPFPPMLPGVPSVPSYQPTRRVLPTTPESTRRLTTPDAVHHLYLRFSCIDAHCVVPTRGIKWAPTKWTERPAGYLA